jgi:serine protease AprX
MKVKLTTVFVFIVITGCTQQIPQKYFVAFTDKNGTPYSISNPQAFLTQRAIDRRNNQGIPVIEQDLPVNPVYVDSVAAKGVQVFTRSKWFNGITVKAIDSSVLNSIRALPFVQSVIRITSYNSKNTAVKVPKVSHKNQDSQRNQNRIHDLSGQPMTYDYGPSYAQIHQVNGDVLHNMGFRGQGKVIALLDAGFLHVDINPDFDSLWANNQILGSRDLVRPGSNVYLGDNHGAATLSIMACDDPGNLIGTAPKASYWLIRTEDSTNNIINEYNWEAGVEMADSVGTDIISSSVAYNVFDNGWMDHTCADMNGNTNPSTRGANIAYSKGMALCIAAGNSGGSGWTCVGSPADAFDVLAIGAVDSLGNYAPFSANGIVNGTYVKPNITAMGVHTIVASPDNSYGYSSGTSFSTPINAGMMACLWQAQASQAMTPGQLYTAIEKSASQYSHPDSLLGYGIPDYAKALQILSTGIKTSTHLQVYPNPFTNYFTVSLASNSYGNIYLSLISVSGQVVQNTRKTIQQNEANFIKIDNLTNLTPGMYILKIVSPGNTDYTTLIKTGIE